MDITRESTVADIMDCEPCYAECNVLIDLHDDITGVINGYLGGIERVVLSRVCRAVAATFRGELPSKSQSLNLAVCTGSVSLVEWVYDNGCIGDNDTGWMSVFYGENINIVKWVHEHGFQFGNHAIAFAAADGHIDILQYLRGVGCKWNEDACAYAAKYGQLDALKWLIMNGCPYDAKTPKYAALGGHTEIVEWLKSENIAPTMYVMNFY